jgi:hypothetical protein
MMATTPSSPPTANDFFNSLPMKLTHGEARILFYVLTKCANLTL